MEKNEPSDCAAERDDDDQLSRFPGLAGKLRRLLREADERGPTSRILGDYRILNEIGRGGMAAVYEAEQISLRRRVALKILSAHLSLSDRAVQKFRREAEAASRQTHPGVVTVHALGEEDGVYYIAAELVEGGRTLADQLEEQRHAGETERGYFRRVAEQIAAVAEALEHVHASGVIHRDVKPSNILITPEGRPRITDFGLARVEDALALSRTGDFLGTPYYMSPEQVLGGRRKVDRRTDIFSLGVTLYECLTLVRPFGGNTPQAVLNEIVVVEPHALLGADSRVPRDLRVICLKALDKDRRHRYQSMAEFAEDLRRFLAGEAILARPISVARRGVRWFRRRRASVIGAVSIVLAVAVVGFLGLELHRHQQRDLEEALADCVHWHDALGYPATRDGRMVAVWITECLPGSPSGSWFQGLFAFDDQEEPWDLEAAAEHLKRCITESEAPPPGAIRLASEAHYLLFLVELARAEQAASPDERERRLAAAGESLALSGESDPADRGMLILRRLDRAVIPEEGMQAVRRGLQLNREHPVAGLFRGIRRWNELYKGGPIWHFSEAKQGFDAVLVDHPRNVPALTFVARTQYFFARTYDFLGLLRPAREYAERAVEHAGDRPYFLNHVTMGQIDLLRGEHALAREEFEKALEVLGEGRSQGVHNAYRGIGRAALNLGETEEAFEWLEKTRLRQPHDPHLCVALAEYYLSIGDPVSALEHVTRAVGRQSGSTTGSYSLHASVYLACARAELALGHEADALEYLELLNRQARDYPRTWSLACLLLPTWSEEAIDANPRIVRLAQELAGRAGPNVILEGRYSPVCLAAQGAAQYLRGPEHYQEAIESFRQAVDARYRQWAGEFGLTEFHWAENARDRYYLAILHAALARHAPSENPEALDRARELYELAERDYREKTRLPETADLLERVRHQAREVLGQED